MENSLVKFSYLSLPQIFVIYVAYYYSIYETLEPNGRFLVPPFFLQISKSNNVLVSYLYTTISVKDKKNIYIIDSIFVSVRIICKRNRRERTRRAIFAVTNHFKETATLYLFLNSIYFTIIT